MLINENDVNYNLEENPNPSSPKTVGDVLREKSNYVTSPNYKISISNKQQVPKILNCLFHPDDEQIFANSCVHRNLSFWTDKKYGSSLDSQWMGITINSYDDDATMEDDSDDIGFYSQTI